MQEVSVSAVCRACKGCGLYIGMAERRGIAVVCSSCDGTGETTITYEPFVQRAQAPDAVRSVHLARGYGLDTKHPLCDGGMPLDQWSPGTVVPADEKLYCPFLYTYQRWCAHPDPRYPEYHVAPMTVGGYVSDCPRWPEKAECWERYHAATDAPKMTV